MRSLIVILVLVALAVAAYTLLSTRIATLNDAGTGAISLEGYTETSVDIENNTLTFRSDCYELSMIVHEVQALSIKGGIEDRIEIRPLTHDIMRDMIENFGIKVDAVRVESFRDGIYYARIFMSQGSKALDVDSRPTDAVGIAVRLGAPVYFNQQLLEQYGTKIC